MYCSGLQFLILRDLINNKLLDWLVRSRMPTATPSPNAVLAVTVTLYSEKGAENK